MNNAGNTLIILTPGFPIAETDTTCLPLQQAFVKSLKNSYPHLNLIVLSFQYPFSKTTYKWFDVTVRSFNGHNKGGFTKLLLRRRLNEALKAINDSTKICGILSFWYGECALAGKRFADKHNTSHYCWILGQDAKKENKYPAQVRLNGNELIALSDFLQDEFEKNHNVRPYHVIPSAINPLQFNKPPEEKPIDILGAGSLIPLKRYEIFLEILTELKKEHPGIKGMLVGDGPEKEKLQVLITKCGLGKNLILTGELPHDDVLQMMQRSKILLHPSSYEGFSGVCLEALYSGAHVISFCRAMKQEFKNWHIVPHKEAMKQQALLILKDPGTDYSGQSAFLMTDIVKRVAGLFNIFN